MGNQTTIIIRNDAIHEIEKNPHEFVRNLCNAIERVAGGFANNGIDIPTGNHANVARVIEVHHSDSTTIIASGASTALKHFESG